MSYGAKGVRLSRLLGRVTELFEEQISPHEVWVRAEISSFKKHHSGHYYFELVEHENNRQVAKCRATLWRAQADAIAHRTQMNIDHVLADGREVLSLVRLTYHPVYGLSVNILDIDPSFALGEAEKRKRETLDKLKKGGLLEKNRKKQLPTVIQRIALIAAESSAGYADFTQQLLKNAYGYHFSITHYSARVQGHEAVQDLTAPLVALNASEFDVVVVIRGGGAAMDLDVFNDLKLNTAFANAPLPVIVGIGHETDRTVLDEVAHSSLKTPSAVGAWLVERMRDFEIGISTTFGAILEEYRSMVEGEKRTLAEQTRSLVHRTTQSTRVSRDYMEALRSEIHQWSYNYTRDRRDSIKLTGSALYSQVHQRIGDHRHELSNRLNQLDRLSSEVQIVAQNRLKTIEELIGLYHPNATLQRGYAYLKSNGKVLRHADQVDVDQLVQIETMTATLSAQITEVNRKTTPGNDK